MSAPPRQRPPMDERIRERRRNVRQAAARRRRRRTFAVLWLIVLAAGAYGVTRSPLFAITGVTVAGVEPEQADAIREAAAVQAGQNLLDADLEAARVRVTALPWIADARLRREPPSTVAVEVTPRRPVAVVEGLGATAIVDSSAFVIAATTPGDDDASPDVPGRRRPTVEVSAPHAVVPRAGNRMTDAAVQAALDVHAGLPRDLRRAVVRYDAVSRRGLEAHLRADRLVGSGTPRTVLVRLGGADRLSDKAAVLHSLIVQLRKARALHRVGAVDVRAPGNPVVVPAASS